jgi:hypothetical protein
MILQVDQTARERSAHAFEELGVGGTGRATDEVNMARGELFLRGARRGH